MVMSYPNRIVSSAPAEGRRPAERRAVRKACHARSGRARMPTAMAADSRGGHVANERSCVVKAQVVLASMREHRFIDL